MNPIFDLRSNKLYVVAEARCGTSVSSYENPFCTGLLYIWARGAPNGRRRLLSARAVVHNRSHARWQQIMTDPTYGPDQYGSEVIHDTWVVQSNHGFVSPRAPTSFFCRPLCFMRDCPSELERFAGK